jgi:hypothetical protein
MRHLSTKVSRRAMGRGEPCQEDFFMVYLMTEYVDYTVSSGRIISELNRTWKEAVMAQSFIALEVLRRTIEKPDKIAGVTAHIWPRLLLNSNLEHYHYMSLIGQVEVLC